MPAHGVVNDYTGEALANLLQEHDRQGLAVLVLRDELSGLFGSLNAYRGGRGADEQMLLELFDGGSYTGLRVKGDRAYSRSHVAIFGNIQPVILSALVGGSDPSGKWARFLFCAMPEKVVALPTVVSKEQEQKISAAVKKRYAGYKWRSPKAAWDWKKSDNPNQLPLAVLKARRDRLSGLITQRGGK